MVSLFLLSRQSWEKLSIVHLLIYKNIFWLNPWWHHCTPPPDPPGVPKDVQIADFDADFVDLTWKKPEGDGGSPITGYIIEKRDRYR